MNIGRAEKNVNDFEIFYGIDWFPSGKQRGFISCVWFICLL